MEFYLGLSPPGFVPLCFNSQRDGILRKTQFRFGYIARVSIPNGMEFYDIDEDNLLPKQIVSIPNGMEFYRDQKR